MKKAYSYIRYSSPQQAKGDSFRRQLSATQAYCEKHGYELDTELSVYQELGVSGFSGDQENLKRFFNDCEIGRVKKGSLLIVENLDRLSRQKINVAMSQFLNLLNYVDVYTLQDQKLYSNSDTDSQAQLLDVMTSLIIMSRAYEESATKQKRLKASWDEKRKNISNKKMTSLIPHWLELSEDKTEFLLKEDKVRIIRFIFEKCIEGMGTSQLLRVLNGDLEKYPTPTHKSKIWARTSLKRFLQDRSVLGEYQPHIGKHNGIGDKARKPLGEPILDYYPQIIDEETFLKAQIAKKNRYVGRGKIGKSHFSNIFRNILICANCKGSMEYVNKGAKPKGGQYLTCGNAKRGGGCSNNKHFRYEAIETLFLHLIADNGFLPKPEKSSDLNFQLEKLKELHKKETDKLKILLKSDFSNSLIQEELNETSRIINEYDLKIKDIEDKLYSTQKNYVFEDLFYDVAKEEDVNKRYNTRINLNSHISKNIKSAQIFYHHSTFISFTMKDDSIKLLTLDAKNNFGGCSGNGFSTYKRLGGQETDSDFRVWEHQNEFLNLAFNFYNINNDDINNALSNISKALSKIILNITSENLQELINKNNEFSNVLEEINKKGF